jgi:hypothetical protein
MARFTSASSSDDSRPAASSGGRESLPTITPRRSTDGALTAG